MRRSLSAGFALALLATGALAAGDKGKPKAEPGGFLDVYPFAAPLIHDGRLVNYVFVSVRLQTAPGVDAQALKPKEPFMRDALVRAAHRTPFGKAGVLTEVDEARVIAAAMAEARRLIGPGTFVAASIKKQTPQRVSGLPAVRRQTAAR